MISISKWWWYGVSELEDRKIEITHSDHRKNSKTMKRVEMLWVKTENSNIYFLLFEKSNISVTEIPEKKVNNVVQKKYEEMLIENVSHLVKDTPRDSRGSVNPK